MIIYRGGTQMTQMGQIYTVFIFSLCICGHHVESVSSVCHINSHLLLQRNEKSINSWRLPEKTIAFRF